MSDQDYRTLYPQDGHVHYWEHDFRGRQAETTRRERAARIVDVQAQRASSMRQHPSND